ncbi:hypothetical protein FKZ61_011335 [Litorilinea aerophila]|uniref:hypothetical protein n=1 Tax=Litorilinea aerophila TaxID=1204385 RepID=UPI000B72F771|nr:hypothetical protein [Litorilinea aerophila]MCC9076701.1 hypothetical protein [Litorilinea aerophila]OUC06310.1 hypothetical protein RY27_21845 [Litorilinea aerophila]
MIRTGVAYMGHHNPKHLATDLRAMQELQLDDVLVCLQENDFVHFTGKVHFTPSIAREAGLRPLAIFWGALNLFGGGRSSQFLLEHPECFQVGRDGSHRPAGCYVNPTSVARIQEMIDIIAQAGYAGYFVDEPTPLRACYCPACREKFATLYDGAELAAAPEPLQEEFRQRCVVDYVRTIAAYCKAHHPHLETLCCLMPVDRAMWAAAAAIDSLDNIGTDIYWVNNDRPLDEMTPLLQEMTDVTRQHGKVHHEWLQCWRVQAGREPRIFDQGQRLVQARPDAIYVWAWEGQIGTTEACEDPAAAWGQVCRVLRLAKAD